MNDKNKKRLSDWVWIILFVLFIGSIFWSILFETLIPLWQSGLRTEFWLNILGIPVILLGTVVFVYGGWVFVRDTFRAMASDEMLEHLAAIRENPRMPIKARMRNLKILLRAWAPGALWLAVGFGMIMVGGVTINLLTILN